MKAVATRCEEAFLQTVWTVAPGIALLGSTADYIDVYLKGMHARRELIEFGNAGPNLVHMLVCLSQMRCSDPRDTIYSLIGLSQDMKTLKAEYDASFNDILATVARLYLDCNSSRLGDSSMERCLLLWSAACMPRISAGLPTWVPDWFVPFQFASERHRQAVFNSTRSVRGPMYLDEGQMQVKRGIAVTVGHLRVEGLLLRQCLHDGTDQEPVCESCDVNTEVWWLKQGRNIFELGERQDEFGAISLKLRGYGGCTDDAMTRKRFSYTPEGTLLPRGSLKEALNAFIRATWTKVRIR